MTDFIQVRSVDTYQFEDDSEEEEEVELDQVPEEPASKDEDFPDLPPLVPPAGAGIPSEQPAPADVPASDTVFVEVPSGDLPGTTDGFGGLALGIAALAVGWIVIRWLGCSLSRRLVYNKVQAAESPFNFGGGRG